MISGDGWLDWAIRLPRTDGQLRVNPGTNEAKGIFFHSAEGYKNNLLSLATTGPLSWHFSNLLDGTFYQHYPITARCWHATMGNQSYLGCEDEGTYQNEPSLNELQIQNAVRLTKEISSLKGWIPSRPTSKVDITHTLWEHNEVIRLGGSSTQCPSGRIPWAEILRRLAIPDIKNGLLTEGNFQIVYNNDIPVWRWGSTDGNFPGRISKLFGKDWLWLRVDEHGMAIWSNVEGD